MTIACSSPSPTATMRDDAGRDVAVRRPVRRVVTLAPNLTEIVFAIGAGPKIVATDSFSDTPAAAKALPKVGGVPPNVERIVAAHPDLAVTVATSGDPALGSALAAANVPLFVMRTDRMADVPRAMETLGTILDAPGASRAAAALREGIHAQRRVRARAPRVVFAVWTEPLYVAGTDTFANDLFLLCGARNVVATKGWPQYSLESLVASPPDLLLYPDRSVKAAAVEQLFRTAPELRTRTTAVAVDENLFTRPGPRMAQAAAELNSILDRWQTAHP